MIKYRQNAVLGVGEIIRVFNASGIRRPTNDAARIEAMFANANLVISAWSGQKLIGICRALTDFSYCCYLSDLAVDKEFQHKGVGKTLIEHVRSIIGDRVSLILVSAPDAVDFYPNVGFERLDTGFIIKRSK